MLQGITEREYTIYFTDDYYLSDTCSYPVLYLLHGGNCSNTDWVHWAIYRWLLTLVAKGLSSKMIIVCPEANKNNIFGSMLPIEI